MTIKIILLGRLFQNVFNSTIVMNKFLLIILFFPFFGLSQTTYNNDSIIDNSKGISITNFTKWSKNNEGIIFFCPLSNLTDSNYIKASDIFKKDERFNKFNGKFTLVFYKENNINNSKNPFLNKIFTKDSIINQLQCFVVTKNCKSIERVKQKFIKKYQIKNEFLPLGIYRIEIEDIACPKNLATKTGLYLEILNEIFVPIYSTEEKLEMLELRIKSLENEIRLLKNQNSTSIIEIQEFQKK